MKPGHHLPRKVDLRKLIVLLYFGLPVTFYLLPWLWSMQQGGLLLHFFKTFFIDSTTLLKLFVGYAALGAGILIALKPTGFSLTLRLRRSVLSDIVVCGLFALYFKMGGGFAGALIFPLIIVLIAHHWPHHLAFVFLGAVATVQLLFHEDRYPVMLVLILWALPWVSQFSYRRLVLAAGFSLVLLIYVLQPLRSGLVPFSSGSTLGELGYFAIHLQPIYIGAYLSNVLDFAPDVLWSEAVPLLKSLLGNTSVVELVAEVGLPGDVILTGTRLGSNSSMYFSWAGWPVLVYGLILIGALAFTMRSSVSRNALLILLVVQGPYFVRRSIGSLIIDLILLAVLLLMSRALVALLRQVRQPGPLISDSPQEG